MVSRPISRNICGCESLIDLNRYLDWDGVCAGGNCPLCAIEEYLMQAAGVSVRHLELPASLRAKYSLVNINCIVQLPFGVSVSAGRDL